MLDLGGMEMGNDGDSEDITGGAGIGVDGAGEDGDGEDGTGSDRIGEDGANPAAPASCGLWIH